MPGLIAPVSYDRLHNETGQWRGYPKNRNVIDFSSKSLKNAADVCVLKTECKLDPKESNTHVYDLGNMKQRFRASNSCWHSFSYYKPIGNNRSFFHNYDPVFNS